MLEGKRLMYRSCYSLTSARRAGSLCVMIAFVLPCKDRRVSCGVVVAMTERRGAFGVCMYGQCAALKIYMSLKSEITSARPSYTTSRTMLSHSELYKIVIRMVFSAFCLCCLGVIPLPVAYRSF